MVLTDEMTANGKPEAEVHKRTQWVLAVKEAQNFQWWQNSAQSQIQKLIKDQWYTLKGKATTFVKSNPFLKYKDLEIL